MVSFKIIERLNTEVQKQEVLVRPEFSSRDLTRVINKLFLEDGYSIALRHDYFYHTSLVEEDGTYEGIVVAYNEDGVAYDRNFIMSRANYLGNLDELLYLDESVKEKFRLAEEAKAKFRIKLMAALTKLRYSEDKDLAFGKSLYCQRFDFVETIVMDGEIVYLVDSTHFFNRHTSEWELIESNPTLSLYMMG